MDPDSEETRTIFEPSGRRCARWREWIRKGGAMEDVAGKGQFGCVAPEDVLQIGQEQRLGVG